MDVNVVDRIVVKTWNDVGKWQVVVNNSFSRDCAHVFSAAAHTGALESTDS